MPYIPRRTWESYPSGRPRSPNGSTGSSAGKSWTSQASGGSCGSFDEITVDTRQGPLLSEGCVLGEVVLRSEAPPGDPLGAPGDLGVVRVCFEHVRTLVRHSLHHP